MSVIIFGFEEGREGKVEFRIEKLCGVGFLIRIEVFG